MCVFSVAPSDDESKGYKDVGQCTQVDNGEYSDDDSYMGDGGMYGATQVDDDYIRRLAESDELLEKVGQNVPHVAFEALESVPPAHFTTADRSTSGPSVHMDETYVPAEEVDGHDVPNSSAEAVSTESGERDRAEVEEPRKPAESNEEESEDDGEEDYVDFCIADTQPPTRHSSLHNKQPSTSFAVGATAAPEVATEPATMYQEDQQAETHLTVYDYLSLSAPLSHEIAKPEENVFSALDGPSHPLPTAATSASMSSTAFATAKTGTVYRTPRLGSKDAPLNVEESPTQLDGSLHLSGDSHSVGGSLASHVSASSHSVLLSGEEALLVAEKEKSPEAMVAAVQPVVVVNPVVRADTGGEWLSTKNPKAPVLPPMAPTLLRLTPQKKAPASPANASTGSGSKNVRAGESETQLFDVEDSQALGDVLDGKSLEELVRMQEKLSRAIHSKTQNVTIHTPRQAEAGGVAEKASVDVPLARQQTSYGLSQPSNMAVSSLMMLKTTSNDAAISPGSTEKRKYNTFAADPALAAVTPAGSNASHSANGGGSAGSATSNTSATHTPSPNSSARKFLKRKFGKPQSHVQALAAVAEEANLQFEMSDEDDEDSEVPSPGSSDHEGKRSKAEIAMASGAKAVTSKSSSSARAADKTAAVASGTSAGGKSKVRRIIIEDTQEDPDDGPVDNDKETQRVDDEDAEFTADYFVRSPGPAAAPTVTSAKSKESDAIAEALPVDFPKFFLQKIPVKFSELWHALTDIGWFWKRGGGIVSYYYVRPNCLVKKGYVMGRDYFGDENEVNKYVTKVVSEARAALKKQGIDVAPPPPPKAVLVPDPRPVASSSGSNAATSVKPSGTTNNTSNVATTSKVSHIPAARQLVPQFSTVSVTNGLLPPDDPCMSDIRRIPWKWLWKLLRERDWTWDFGPAHTNFYFAPGYDIRSKHAVLGEHKFDSEESVRRFVRKQNWPEFSKQQQHEEHSSAESQLPDAYLKDPTWQLASHRQKREREARPSDEDNNSSEGEEGARDFASKSATSKTHAKKAAKTVEIAASRVSAVSKTAAVKSGKSAASGQSQKRNFTPEHDEPEQATQAQVANTKNEINRLALVHLYFIMCPTENVPSVAAEEEANERARCGFVFLREAVRRVRHS